MKKTGFLPFGMKCLNFFAQNKDIPPNRQLTEKEAKTISVQ